MDDPASTNSGLSALVGVATAVAGGGGALHGAEVTQASPRLREFFTGQALKAASSAALISEYLRAQDSGDAQGGPVDGLIDYESNLVALNASGKLREPLTLIYPANGVVTATYPLSLLATAAPPARAAYERLVSYLLTPAVQQQIMRRTYRRPATPQVPLDIPPHDPQHERDLVNAYIDAQAAGGSSAIYDGLIAAYQAITSQAAADPDRITTVVLLTAGRVTAGSDLAAFTRFYRALPTAVASAPVFPVIFDTPGVPGTANIAQMDQLAALTGGQVFVASRLQLGAILTLIRENQLSPAARRKSRLP